MLKSNENELIEGLVGVGAKVVRVVVVGAVVVPAKVWFVFVAILVLFMIWEVVVLLLLLLVVLVVGTIKKIYLM